MSTDEPIARGAAYYNWVVLIQVDFMITYGVQSIQAAFADSISEGL